MMFKMVPYLYKLFSYDINFLTPDSVRHFQAGSSFIVKSVTFVAAVCVMMLIFIHVPTLNTFSSTFFTFTENTHHNHNLLHIHIDSVVLNYYIT